MPSPIYAFGYRYNKAFSSMPKLRVEWGLGRLGVFDQNWLIPNALVKVKAISKRVTLTVPWEMLGEPEIAFAQAWGLAGGTPVSQTAWQVLTRKPPSRPKAP